MLTISPARNSDADVAALVERVAALERAQRDEDVDGFLDLFEPDAVWVTGGGRRLIGFAAIAEFTRQVLPGAMADGSVAYEVVHVAFVRDDVAITNVHQQYVDLNGNPKPEMVGSPSYVWSRREGAWRIVAGQNTSVVSD